MIFERDGAVYVHATGGTFQGAAVIEIFQRQCDAEFLDDWEHAKAEAAHTGVAVILSRRRCLWPGCGRASSRNHIDHTHDHSRGGRTTPHNGGPACGRHNRTKTRGYTVHRDTHGNWHVHRPDGTELTQPAAA